MIAQIEKQASPVARGVTILLAILLIAALLSIQALIGGTRILFALPAYGLLAAIGVIAVALIRVSKPTPDQACFLEHNHFLWLLVRPGFSFARSIPGAL